MCGKKVAKGGKKDFQFQGIAELDISQIKQAVQNIQRSLQKGFVLPSNINKNFTKIFDKIQSEIKNFSSLAETAQTSLDFNNTIKSGNSIIKLYNTLRGEIKTLGTLSNEEKKKMFPEEVTRNIENAQKALSNYNKSVQENEKELKRQSSTIQKISNCKKARKRKRVSRRFKKISFIC